MQTSSRNKPKQIVETRVRVITTHYLHFYVPTKPPVSVAALQRGRQQYCPRCLVQGHLLYCPSSHCLLGRGRGQASSLQAALQAGQAELVYPVLLRRLHRSSVPSSLVQAEGAVVQADQRLAPRTRKGPSPMPNRRGA